ncbi:MAG: type I secretion system permease/ATPase [Oxalobacteraceae bacterium]|nr:type I secretion system permease/ATPase [Oxalobacteraceae bacterium]
MKSLIDTSLPAANHPLSSGDSLFSSLLTFKREFFWVAVYSLIANALTLVPTLYMLQLYDRVMLSQSETTLLAITLITAVMIAAMAFSEWIRSRLLVRAGVRLDEQLNSRIFLAQFQSQLELSRSEPTNTFNALTRLRQFLTGVGIIAFFDLPWTPIYLLVLFIMHPILGWFGVAFSVLLFCIALLNNWLTANAVRSATLAENQTLSFMSRKLRHAEVISAMGMLPNLKQRWLRHYHEYIATQWHAQQRVGAFSAFSKFTQYAQQSIILALGAWLAIRGDISAGAMIAANILMGNALRPIGILVSTWKEFVQAKQSFTEISTLLDQYPERRSRLHSDEVEGQISIRELTARAPNRAQPVLDNINIDFESGKLISIVGASGAGKSTFARCLIGIWPHIDGAVLIDSVDVRDWSRQSLGPQIGYLPQEVELFDGTIAENICRFGEIDSDAIIEAAKRADIHDMVLRLPKGYDTPIGLAGRMLSGGQRQRIALARAIYGWPKLVVLDEPNSNLDEAGEAALISVIRELKSSGRTVFMVLHQPKFLAEADQVVTIVDGRIGNIPPTPRIAAK